MIIKSYAHTRVFIYMCVCVKVSKGVCIFSKLKCFFIPVFSSLFTLHTHTPYACVCVCVSVLVSFPFLCFAFRVVINGYRRKTKHKQTNKKNATAAAAASAQYSAFSSLHDLLLNTRCRKYQTIKKTKKN